MKLKEFDIMLDIKRSQKHDYIEVVQGDYETNILNIQITENLQPYNLTGLSAEIAFAKPDNTTVLQDMDNGVTIEDAEQGKIKVVLKTNTIAAAGKVYAEVRIKDGDMILTTARFDFFVRRAIFGDDTIKSKDEWPLYEQLLEAAENENERIDNENTRIQNETQRENQEIIRQQNEQDRTTAESARNVAESDRQTNEQSRINNESIRQQQESDRMVNEQERINAEEQRISAESERLSAENERISREQERIENENTRVANEAERQLAEQERINAENMRISNETTRQSNEQARTNAELERQTNEQLRREQEDYRQASIADIENRWDQLTTAQQQDAEVIDARTSTIKEKTFPTLNARLEEIEQDVNKPVYSDTITIEGGIGSIPSNAEGQVSAIVKGQTRTNIAPTTVEDWEQGGFAHTGVGSTHTLIDSDVVIRMIALKPITSDKQFTASLANGYEFRLLGVDSSNIITESYGWTDKVTFTTKAQTETYRIAIRKTSLEAITPSEIINAKMLLEAGDQVKHFITGTKSTISAVRIKSVGKNLLKDGEFYDSRYSYERGFLEQSKSRIVENTTKILRVNQLGNYSGAGQVVRVKKGEDITLSAIKRSNNEVKLRITEARTIQEAFAAPTSMGQRRCVHRPLSIGERRSVTLTSVTTDYVVITVDGPSISSPETLEVEDLMLEYGTTATAYEPYKESNAYVIAKDEEGNILELRSLPNGTKDEIRVSEGKAIIKIGTKTDVVSGTVINYTDMAENGTYYAWNEDGETETGIKGDTLGIDATTLIYQLAEPITYPINIEGEVIAYPNGTVYIEPYIADMFEYNDGITFDYPVSEIDKIKGIVDGKWVELDNEYTLSEDGLTLTIEGVENGQQIKVYAPIQEGESTIGTLDITVPCNLKAQVRGNMKMAQLAHDKIVDLNDFTVAMLLNHEIRLTTLETMQGGN